MKYFKDKDGVSLVNSDTVTQSEYDKATIEYPVEKVIYKTTTEKKQDTVIDADGKEHILRTYEVEVPVLDKSGNPVVAEKIREMVRYNPYDAQGIVIIPDDAKTLTEEEYKLELEKMKQVLEITK